MVLKMSEFVVATEKAIRMELRLFDLFSIASGRSFAKRNCGIAKHLQWCLLAISLAALHSPAEAVVYYLDAKAGNDSWSGRLEKPQGQLGVDGPWRTLARASVVQLAAGDKLLLRCGQMFRGSLRVRANGKPDSPAKISGFGDCSGNNKPFIDGAEEVVGWQRNVGGGFVATVEGEVTQVFVNGEYLWPAAFPLSGYELLPAGSAPARNQLAVSSQICSHRDDLAGASFHVRTQPWMIEDRIVAGCDGGRLVLDKDLNYPAVSGTGYYLTGKLWMMNQPGAWGYDRIARRLYVWLKGDVDPQMNRVEASIHECPLMIDDSKQVVVGGVTVRHAAQDGVAVRQTRGFVLREIDVWDSGRDSVNISAQSQGVIEISHLANSVRDGITIEHSDGTRVLGNLIENSGTVGPPVKTNAAINAKTSNYVRISGNHVRKTGYNGINFKKRSLVVNNVLEDICMVLADCGAIYTWSNTDPSPPYDSEIDGNIVLNVHGNHDGVPDDRNWAAGIYLDDLANGIAVHGNTVVNAEQGIYLHNSFANQVSDNVLFGNRAAQLTVFFNHPNFVSNMAPDNWFKVNTIVPIGSVKGVELFTLYDKANWGQFKANHYATVLAKEVLEVSTRPAYHLSNRTQTRRYTIGQLGAFQAGEKTTQAVRKLSSLSSSRVSSRKVARLIGNSARYIEAGSFSILINTHVDSVIVSRLDIPRGCREFEDIDGKALNWPLTVPAYQSRIMVCAD